MTNKESIQNPMTKPYAESCDQNRDPIFAVIEPYLSQSTSVLEIGSGTGQHAIYFAAKLPHLVWHTSDRAEYHNGILQWITEASLENVREPLLLDVTRSPWPQKKYDAVFSANTTHIMHWQDVESLFKGIGAVLAINAVFMLYGPFNFGGQYTSESNHQFDLRLKMRDPLSGVRNFEDLDQLAINADLRFVNDHEMPCNNRILVWKKI